MNYKIDYNFLEITNAPSIEYYFEKRAREGWLIEQIYLGSIFIFKKIEPIELDFSIQPYILPYDDWHYVGESYDLHIYYKEYKAEVTSYEIPAVEEYEILEAIGQRRIQGNTLQVFLFLLLGWFNVSGIYTSPDFLKDGAAQLIVPIIFVGLAISIWGILHITRFLKINRDNLKAGQPIEYSDSMFLVPTTTFFLGTVLLVLFVFHFLYMGIVTRSFIPFIMILIVLTVLALERSYHSIKASDKKSTDYKKIGFTIVTLILLFTGTGLAVFKEAREPKDTRIDEYKVLIADTYDEDPVVLDEILMHDSSILIPTSYEYGYTSYEENVETAYSRALVRDFANDLTKRYLDEKKREYTTRYADQIKRYFDYGTFNDSLLAGGIYEGDLIRLKGLRQKEAEEVALQLIKDRSLVAGDTDLWNVDKVYFLSYRKDELLIQNGREVFYLSGKNFSDPTVIEQTKERLGLR